MMKELSVGDIRKAVDELKKTQAITKEVKYWKMPIKNLELFEALKKQGRLKQTRPDGPWDLV